MGLNKCDLLGLGGFTIALEVGRGRGFLGLTAGLEVSVGLKSPLKP